LAVICIHLITVLSTFWVEDHSVIGWVFLKGGGDYIKL
jgi:hypothetical protein